LRLLDLAMVPLGLSNCERLAGLPQDQAVSRASIGRYTAYRLAWRRLAGSVDHQSPGRSLDLSAVGVERFRLLGEKAGGAGVQL
jgi:hypothetical protein